MKLTLTNVRQHENLELDFPDTGLIMVTGISGAGKTTVLDAICDALYGETDDLVPWGESRSSITLEIYKPKYLKITRTRGSHTLTVTTENGESFCDDVAQGIINEAVGMSIHEFLASSYIQQESEGSLLKLGPTDQLRFIQNLGFSKFNPDEIKDKINKMINAREKVLEAETVLLNSQISNIAAEVSNTERLTKSLVPVVGDEEALRGSAETEREILGKKEVAGKSVMALSKEQGSPIYVKIAAVDGVSENFKLMEVKATSAIDVIDTELAGLAKPFAEKTKEDIDKTFELISSKSRRLDVIDQMKAFTIRTNERYPDSRGASSLEFLGITKKATEALLENNREQTVLNNAETLELQNALLVQHCPDCNAPLSVSSGNIIKSNSIPGNIPELLSDCNKKGATLVVMNATLRNEISYINDEIRRGEALKAQIPADTLEFIETKEALSEYKSKLETYIKDQNELMRRIGSLEVNKKLLIESIETERKKVATLQLEVKNAVFRDIETIKAEMLAIQNTISEYDSQLAAVAGAGAAYNSFMLLKKENETRAAFVVEAEMKIAGLLLNKGNQEKKVNDLKINLMAAIRLKELSDSASASAIEMAIDSINGAASGFIDKMFTEDGTTINIRNSSSNKKGLEKPKPSLEILHKGKTVKKLSSLSGGERARAVLAFQLAMSEIYKSKILMIDEGFTGLNEEKRAECMEVLRELATDKLIIVIEHGAKESLFDKVVRI